MPRPWRGEVALNRPPGTPHGSRWVPTSVLDVSSKTLALPLKLHRGAPQGHAVPPFSLSSLCGRR